MEDELRNNWIERRNEILNDIGKEIFSKQRFVMENPEYHFVVETHQEIYMKKSWIVLKEMPTLNENVSLHISNMIPDHHLQEIFFSVPNKEDVTIGLKERKTVVLEFNVANAAQVAMDYLYEHLLKNCAVIRKF